jgi:glutaredoxin
MKVILYSTNCPKCKVLESKLNAAGIEFELIEDADVMIDKGFMSAPMLEVDGIALDFGKAVDWVKENA